ncbi:MAG: transposase [Acidimicrobiia bacterium]|nr:transposase [Acidimicrobiia bacterium]
MKLPRHSPNLNAFAERAIQTLKHECLNHFVIFGERHLNHLVSEFADFYNHCRPHSARGRLPPIRNGPIQIESEICCDSRLGGLLKYYYLRAA